MTFFISYIFFSFPKYIFLIFFYFIFHFKKWKIMNLLDLDYLIIFIFVFLYLSNSPLTIVHQILWSLMYCLFFFILSNYEDIKEKKFFIKILKIMVLCFVAKILLTVLLSLYIEYPISREGFISLFTRIPNNYYLNFTKDISQLSKYVTSISNFYLLLYILTFSTISYIIFYKSRISYLFFVLLLFIFILGNSFGSRSFLIFFVISFFLLTFHSSKFYKNNLYSIILLVILFVIIILTNSNLLIKDNLTASQRLTIKDNLTASQRLTINDYRTGFFRIEDNYYGIKAVLNGYAGKNIDVFMEKINEHGYFVKQRIFHNEYLNSIYFGGYICLLLFIYLNLKFLYYIFNIKYPKDKHYFITIIYIFLSFQFLFNIEIPLTTDKNFFLIFLTFYIFAKNINKNNKFNFRFINNLKKLKK
jgi:hypothetical protein